MPPSDARQQDLSVLQIDRSRKDSLEPGGKAPWRPFVYIGVALAVVAIAGVVVSGVIAQAPEVEVQRVRLEPGGASGTVVLTAGGYIVAHHTIQVSSKIVGKVAWVGVEKGDQVKEGQVLVRVEDTEYQAQLAQARANLGVMQARLNELQAGSRPQEIDAARAAAEEAEANFKNAEINLKRAEDLFTQNIASRQQLDNARTQFDVTKAQMVNARKRYDLIKIGPRREQIE